jgi:hypothetical protein
VRSNSTTEKLNQYWLRFRLVYIIFRANKQFCAENTPDLEQYDVHVVGGVFKQYLREQKEPLLTHDLYEGFIAAHGTLILINSNSLVGIRAIYKK